VFAVLLACIVGQHRHRRKSTEVEVKVPKKFCPSWSISLTGTGHALR